MTFFAWEFLNQVFTTGTIMTPLEQVYTWEVDATVSHFDSEDQSQRFDVIPATRNGRIDGLFVGKDRQLESLTTQWLVSRDTTIPHLIDLFVESEKLALLVLYRQEAIGIVTPADLNKMPVRIYIYNLLGELELALADLIRNQFDNTKESLELLSDKRRKEIEDEIGKLEQGNTDVAPVQLLNLSDLINIVCKDKELHRMLDFNSKSACEKSLNGLVHLRNRIMHTVRPLLEQLPKDLVKQHERINRVKELLELLASKNDRKVATEIV